MPSSVRERLRAATHAAHLRLHDHPVLAPLRGDDVTRVSYGRALTGLYGLHAAADRCFEQLWPDRAHRAPLLAGDLAGLGLPVPAPEPAVLPAFAEPAAFLGGRYVVDGSSFGARTLLANIQQRLGLDARHGASFFAGESIDVAGGWRRLLASLEDLKTPDQRDQAQSAALATFQAIERWLDRVTPQPVPARPCPLNSL